MVLSKINKQIEYLDKENIDTKDINYSAAQFEMTLFDVDIVVAIGKPNIEYIDNKIIYFSLYLVNNDRIVSKIGLYEMYSDNVDKYLDEDGDLNLEILEMPILFSYVTENYLIEKSKEKEPEKESEKDSGKELEVSKKTMDNDIYDSSQAKTWIEKYLKSNKYTIKDNEGGGDCLFYVIVDALSGVDASISVDSLRKILVDNVTDELYLGYKELYESYMTSIKNDTERLRELQSENKNLAEQMKLTKDREYQSGLVKRANVIKEEYERIKEEKSITNQMLGEVKFMKGVKNKEALKKKIATCEFWGETWSISTLERVMNIKLILFSEEVYASNDFDNVLQCGQLNDNILEKKGIFRPNYYILVEYNGYHYKLIKYDNKENLSFSEIPNKIKELIVYKCMERQGGLYNLIPEFNEYKKLIDLKNNEDDDTVGMEQTSEGLYTDDIVFQFYSKSNDKPLPGKGNGEKIPKEKVKEFSELSKIPSWRKKLSNFWEEEFELDGHKWLSVEHYYQGSKFKNNNNKYYLEFSLDSGSILSKDPVMAKGAGGKSGKFKNKQIRPPDIKLDDDFFTTDRNIEEMNRAQLAKFMQSDELKKMLIATKNARLMHFQRGSEPVEFTNLMKIRSDLIK